MKDIECVEFLQWALPMLRMRWPGFRKVRRQVCKRIHKRLRQLKLGNTRAYRDFIESHPQENDILDGFCRITISRFYRDKGVFQCVENHVIPELANHILDRDQDALQILSAGCSSGEEPYSLALMWDFKLQVRFPKIHLKLLATDADLQMLNRAEKACYPATAIKDLPMSWRKTAFIRNDALFCLESKHKTNVRLVPHDIRTEIPYHPFHLILCRNLVFTYFNITLQREILQRLWNNLHPAGFLVIGIHENLPDGDEVFTTQDKKYRVFQKKM